MNKQKLKIEKKVYKLNEKKLKLERKMKKLGDKIGVEYEY
jgi:hypothetical protein